MAFPLELLVDDAVFPEAPRWHDGAFWYSDIGAGHVCRVTGLGKKEIIIDGLGRPSGLGWTRSGDLLVVSITTSEIYRYGPDRVQRVVCGPKDHKAEAANDMVTAGSRSYVTCSGREYKPGDDMATYSAPVGEIIMIEHDTHKCRIVARGLNFPNGVAITPDGKKLIAAEVSGSRVIQFDITPDGSLVNQQIFAKLNGMPDGLTLDAEGAVWVGTAVNFQHVDNTGKVLDIIEIPGWNCIACMLGGPDGRTLFMAVSQFSGIEDIMTGKSKGRIMTTKVAVPASPEPK